MAYGRAVDLQDRERRQKLHLAAPILSSEFPGVQEINIVMRFNDPDGREHPSPHKQIFIPEMRGFFDFQCPLRDCVGGGFDLNASVRKALINRNSEGSGIKHCLGHRGRKGIEDQSCRLELQFQVIVVDKSASGKTEPVVSGKKRR